MTVTNSTATGSLVDGGGLDKSNPPTSSHESTVTTPLNPLEDNLPYNQDKLGQINWLGSSFSGADIKVVAHLYGEAETYNPAKELEDAIAEAEAIRSGLETLISNPDIYTLFYLTGKYSVFTQKDFLEMAGMKIGQLGSAAVADYYIPWISARGNASRANVVSNMTKEARMYTSLIDHSQRKLGKLQNQIVKTSSTLVLGNLQTISVQTYREKEAVRALGHSYVKGYTRGQRHIAGSMIFTMFDEHAMATLMRSLNPNPRLKTKDNEPNSDFTMMLTDQLPPIDLTIVFANEYGALAQASLFGVEFFSDGMTLSIEDLLTEEVLQFVARDIDPVISKGNICLERNNRGMHIKQNGKRDETGSDLIFTSRQAYLNFLDKVGVRRFSKNR